MVDRDLVTAKLAVIDRCLARIAEVRGESGRGFRPVDVEDITAINLVRAIQAAIDLATHVVATESYDTPDSTASAFTLLEQSGSWSSISGTFRAWACRSAKPSACRTTLQEIPFVTKSFWRQSVRCSNRASREAHGNAESDNRRRQARRSPTRRNVGDLLDLLLLIPTSRGRCNGSMPYPDEPVADVEGAISTDRAATSRVHLATP